jgi:hypothetical protein
LHKDADLLYQSCTRRSQGLYDLKLSNIVLQLAVHKFEEEADVSGESSSTSSPEDEYIVGIKYESHHEPVISTENSVSAALDVLNLNERVILCSQN